MLPHHKHKKSRVPSREKQTHTISVGNNTIRLNKFIANSGICSRREADKFIAAGVVTVNGEVITIDGGEWLKGAGQFNNLELVTPEMWDFFEMMRKK